jgi:hypothetical protein
VPVAKLIEKETNDEIDKNENAEPIEPTLEGITESSPTVAIHTEIPGALETTTQKDFFQYGDIISINVPEDMYLNAETISLRNETTGTNIISDNSIGNFEISSNGSDPVLVLTIDPSEFESGNVIYGDNVFEVTSKFADGFEYKSYITVSLNTFSILGASAAYFANGLHITNGFQGWFNTVTSPVVVHTQSGSKLNKGWSNVINY